MHSKTVAWAITARFTVRAGFLNGEPRFSPGHSSVKASRYAMYQGFPRGVQSRCVLQGSLTDEESAYIFQRSPYHAERLRRYIALSTGDTASRSEEQESDDESPLPDASPLHFSSHEQLLAAFYAMTGDPLERDGGRIVVYRGSPSARLMIIGEAPGEQEDYQGKPFVGKAGQLLDKIFEYGGFDMERQVYVTNIAKRRPLKNRTPAPEEVEYYMPYLHEEIRLVAPEIIVLAGAVAARAILGPEVRISKVRGNWYRYEDNGPHTMPVFHPSYLLREPSRKYDMVKDIEEIRAQYMRILPEDKLMPLPRAKD